MDDVQTEQGRPKITADEYTRGAIRRVVHSFTVRENIRLWTRCLPVVRRKLQIYPSSAALHFGHCSGQLDLGTEKLKGIDKS